MPATQLSVRQMGPTYARGLARHTREVLEGPARTLFDDALRAMRNRFGLRLRRAEAQRIGNKLLVAARKLAIAPIVRDGLAFTATLPYVEGGVVRIGRFLLAAPPSRLGGYRLSIRVVDLVHLSVHALERMHLRLSTADWSDLAPALASLARMDAVATAARAAGVRWMWLPSGTHGAFVIAFDEVVPVVVAFLDELSHPRASLVAPIGSWLDGSEVDAESLRAILAGSDFDFWRKPRDVRVHHQDVAEMQ